MFDFALGWGMGPTDFDGRTGVRFEVQASTGGPFECLYRANYARLQWHPCAVNLAAYAGKQVRFRFLVEHLDGRIMMDYPYWGNPRIVTGPLDGSAAPQETFSFAMTPAEKVAAVLPDGTEVPLTEPDPVFSKGLVTPGLLNRDLMLLVYAGDNYICVPGRHQPGIYMGVSMSVDYLRIGAGTDRAAWTGKLPPPVFAEWTAPVPSAPPGPTGRNVPAGPKAPAATAPAQPAVAEFHVLQTRADLWKYQPGLIAQADPTALTLEAGMGPSTDLGWGFAGMELVGLREARLRVERRGPFRGTGENAFGGLVLDYHSPRGYADRVFLGLGAGSPRRYDLRPADWILDGPPLTLPRTMGLRPQFIDLSGQVRRGNLQLALGKYAPPDWDGRIWLAAGVQNLSRGAGLKLGLMGVKGTAPVPTGGPEAEVAKLSDEAAEFAVSRRSGAIVGAWDRASGRRLMAPCNDRYTADTEHDVTRTTELLDRVQNLRETQVDGRPALVITCRNVALPAITIKKRYTLLPGRVLAKRVAFSTGDATGCFIHWDAETALDQGFAATSSRGRDLAEQQVVQVPIEQAWHWTEALVTAKDFSLGLGAYRLKVNDRVVLKGTAEALPDGWLNGVCVDYLKAGAPVSAEMRWVMFAGDFTALDRQYQALPEYRGLWAFSKPDWPCRVIGDAMCLGPAETYAFYRACDPDLVTTTIWFLDPPWGNWGPDSEPPRSSHPDVKGIASAWRGMFPNARVSAYTNAMFDDGSDIYRDHLDFAVRDIEGQPITSGVASDSGGRPSFYFQINNLACREYLLKMHESKFREWDFDFFYIDGPFGGAEMPDWGIRDVAQSYDYLEYLRTLRERLQAVKPDAAIFVNGVNTPYTDIGYIEFRDEQWQAIAGPNWRSVALWLLHAKLYEEPGFVVVPTYGWPAADPSLAAYDIMYGWCGHLTEVGRLPWMREAFRYRGMRLVEDAVEPRWWRSNADFEACGFRHGPEAVVNVLDHGTQAREVTVRVDTAKLGLREGVPLRAELRLMTDTASELQPDPADPQKQVRVWKSTEAATVSELFAGRPCPAVLELTLPTRPMLLTTVVLSQPEAAQTPTTE